MAYRSRTRPRRIAACATITLALVTAGCHALRDQTAQSEARGPADGRHATPTALHAEPLATAPNAGSALDELGWLAVVSRRPFIPGYQRSCEHGAACVFGEAWADNPRADGCSTREDLLKSSLTSVVLERGSRCAVESGDLTDPYSGAGINFRADQPDSIEVDHVLPLVTAWALGAAHWTKQQRVRFANDSSVELVAVSRASNQAKGDRGPAGYQPRINTCAYDARFVAVLTKYHLPVIAADKSVIITVLRGCS